MIDINNFLSKQESALYSIIQQDINEIPEYELYSGIDNIKLKYIFSGMHQQLNLLFKFMNEKSKSNRNFNAVESRQLLNLIEILKKMKYYLDKTDLGFSLKREYQKHLDYASEFLKESYGSEIPEDYKDIFIVEYEPIFFMNQLITVTNDMVSGNMNFPLQGIGEGSYAKVYKFIDTNYNITFAVKRAFSKLAPKELARFKKEYLAMRELDSPYIIKVYSYDENKKEYTMEFADYTIQKYLKMNPDLSLDKRKGLSFQILRAFEYLHSKNKFHRDISITNILVKLYEDVEIIKISDFGLVKKPTSNLTSRFTEMKGAFNDPNLELEGFGNYSIWHETYSLTRLIYFVMTNRTNLSNPKNRSQEEFLEKGLSSNKNNRYQTVLELKEHFCRVDW